MEKNQKDHYVAETYLKWFCNSDGKLSVYSKKWLKHQYKSPAQICKEEQGSNNQYFQKERLLEEYLKKCENRWNDSVRIFTSDPTSDKFKLDYLQSKKIIADYIAYLGFGTPAKNRTGQEHLKAIVHKMFEIMYKQGMFPPPPESLKSLLPDIKNNIAVKIDSKYPQAIGISALKEMSDRLFFCSWLRVENQTDIPFITSDNPFCFWYVKNSEQPWIYVPITPKFAVLMRPFLDAKEAISYNHSLDDGEIAKPEFIGKMNDLIIGGAERIVISNVKSDELLRDVKKLKDKKLVTEILEVPMGNGGKIIISKQVIK